MLKLMSDDRRKTTMSVMSRTRTSGWADNLTETEIKSVVGGAVR